MKFSKLPLIASQIGPGSLAISCPIFTKNSFSAVMIGASASYIILFQSAVRTLSSHFFTAS
jgi:hypothetical protein